VADAVATYRVDLEDGTSGPAKNAATALRALETQIKGDQNALREMEKAFKNLNAGTVVNIDAAKKLQAAMKEKKAAIADAQGSILALGGGLGRLPGQGKPALSFLEKIRQAAAVVPVPLAGAAVGVAGLATAFKALGGALVVVALVAAVAAIVVVTLSAVAALGKYGVAQADAHRSELLRLEGLTKLRFWYQSAAMSAGDLQNATDKVSAGVAIGRDQVARYTEQLYRAGLRGDNLSQALEAVAIKASVQGEAAAGAFAGMASSVALAGGSVAKLADDVKARLGGIAARQMLSLSVQSAKLHESFSALFHGLSLEPLLRGLRSVTELFSQQTESGKALKHLMGFLFQPVVDGAETAGLYVRRFFQGFIIAALRVENVILRLRIWFADTFGGSLLGKLDATKLAVYAGQAAFALLAVSVGLAAIAAGALVVALAVLFSPLIGLISLVDNLIDLFSELWTLDWAGMGRDVVAGIVGGLKSGAVWIRDTMTGLADGAYKAFKKRLGIASPSKEFAKLGQTLPQGVAVGVDRDAPRAQDAIERMVSVPQGTIPRAQGGAVAEGGASKGASPSLSIELGGIVIQTQATAAPGIVADIEPALMRLLERVALQLGGKLA
jgi:hypothetical protein